MDKTLRVLIVEDTPDDAELMLLYLARDGMAPEWQRVETESHYLAALRSPPDLILADWNLPQFSGLQALQRLHQQGLDIPFIIVSGSIGEEAAVDALRQGAYDYVLKDRAGRLGSAVQRALEEKRLREERRRAEASLRQLKEFNEGIVQSVTEGIVMTDAEGQMTFVNPALAAMLGEAPEELVGRRWLALAAPDQQVAMQTAEARRAPGKMDRYEIELLRRDGARVPVLVSGRLRFDAATGTYAGALAVVTDISERRKAEAEHLRLLAQVQAQAQQIAQLMDTVPAGIILLDADQRVLMANPTGQRDLATLAGVAAGERLLHLGDLPLGELLASGQRHSPWRQIQAGQRIFEVIARPTDGSGATAGRWVLVINDVTHAHDLRQQLEQQERLAAIGQLAAGIAHDFNNILAIIALYTPLVAQSPLLTERDRERLAVIGEQTAHAARLVQQLLDFSRRAVIERQPLDLGPFLRGHVKLLARTLPETISVTLDCAPGDFIVLADSTRLQQALMNLAINARDAMPAGGSLRLTLSGQAVAPRPDLAPGPWVCLEVADGGNGISPEALAHIFEPFFTTKPRGQGTGLGLAQVHGIVKQHDGEILVHSTPGQGTVFTIYLPALVMMTAPPVPLPTVPAQLGNGETVLIVEDNPALLEAMGDTLEILGYASIGASNGHEALALLETHGERIALVLSDLIMPVMGGEALLAAMRARGLATPLVMLSGHPLEGELQDIKAAGLAGWLLKPPDVDQMGQLLAHILASRA